MLLVVHNVDLNQMNAVVLLKNSNCKYPDKTYHLLLEICQSLRKQKTSPKAGSPEFSRSVSEWPDCGR